MHECDEIALSRSATKYTLDPETVRVIVSSFSSIFNFSRTLFHSPWAAPQTFRVSVNMPSFSDHGASTALQSITHSSMASTALKSLLDNPLTFHKATFGTTTGISGRYTPLNKPFHLESGTVNGITTNGVQNGISLNGSASSPAEKESEKQKESDGVYKPHSQPTTNLGEVISTQWTRVLKRPPGLRNFSNTCYMNSTLQALMHIPPLVSFLLSKTHCSNCISLL